MEERDSESSTEKNEQGADRATDMLLSLVNMGSSTKDLNEGDNMNNDDSNCNDKSVNIVRILITIIDVYLLVIKKFIIKVMKAHLSSKTKTYILNFFISFYQECKSV